MKPINRLIAIMIIISIFLEMPILSTQSNLATPLNSNSKAIWIWKYTYLNASKAIPMQSCLDANGNAYITINIISKNSQSGTYVELISLNKEGYLRWKRDFKGPLSSTQSLSIYCQGNSTFLYLISQNPKTKEELLLLYEISTNGTLIDSRFAKITYLSIKAAYLSWKNMTLYISGDKYNGIRRGLDMAVQALNAHTLLPRGIKTAVDLGSDEVAYAISAKDHTLCLAGLGGVTCINMTNNTPLWSKPYRNLTFNSLLITNNTVITVGGLTKKEKGVLISYNLTDGNILYEYNISWIPSDLLGIEMINRSTIAIWGFAYMNGSINGIIILFNSSRDHLKPIHIIRTFFKNITLVTSLYTSGNHMLILGSSGTYNNLNNVYALLYGPPNESGEHTPPSGFSLEKVLTTYKIMEYVFISITIASIILIIIMLKRYYKK